MNLAVTVLASAPEAVQFGDLAIQALRGAMMGPIDRAEDAEQRNRVDQRTGAGGLTRRNPDREDHEPRDNRCEVPPQHGLQQVALTYQFAAVKIRSEERRVGKERRSRRAP